MSKLVWDKSGERLYETGLSKGVLYVQDNDGSYKTGVAWNGLTSFTESPSGADPTDLYADDIKYATLRAPETFGGTIEAYTYPEEFGQCDGSATPGSLNGVYIGQQERKKFGLVYVTKVGSDSNNDLGYKIHILYGCSVSPSERAYQTVNDSPEAITFSWELTSDPVNVTGHKATSLIIVDSTKCKEHLADLENKLFGDDSSEPTLPTPDEVISLLTDGSSSGGGDDSGGGV